MDLNDLKITLLVLVAAVAVIRHDGRHPMPLWLILTASAASYPLGTLLAAALHVTADPVDLGTTHVSVAALTCVAASTALATARRRVGTG
ncbi:MULTISPECIES: hypothetical protein [Streptomyces]|uniref:Integral membrane protein n=2 Tax=Streptomyces TaxID=1883 RepID=A0ABV9II95_9ACTN